MDTNRINLQGVVSTVAGSTVSGYVDGVATVAKFWNPAGISGDSAGNVWVAEYGNNLIRKISTAGAQSCEILRSICFRSNLNSAILLMKMIIRFAI